MKYILIKRYPGSPELGTIYTRLNNRFLEDEGIPSKTFIDSEFSNHWEEITKKDYEILTFYNGNKDSPIFRLCSNNNYTIGSENVRYVISSEILRKKNWIIHSIKRLSDGEIFIINDNVIFESNKGKCYYKHFRSSKCAIDIKTKIISFIIQENKLLIQIEYNKLYYSLDAPEKIKHPLFKTEDGVDIYESDTYYELITPDFHNKPCIWNILPNKTRDNINYDQEGNRRNGRIWFSTKEKAEEYIIMNKPVLSLKDVASIYPGINKSHPDKPSSQSERLKNLVKSKIQQSV